MQGTSYTLYHSAKGTSWTSKNHKYIAIENGRYIYPDDVKSKASSALSRQGSNNYQQRAKGQTTQLKRQAALRSQTGGAQVGGKTMTPSEYRSQMAKQGIAVNKNGEIRANSPAARGSSKVLASAQRAATRAASAVSTKAPSNGTYTPSDRTITAGPNPAQGRTNTPKQSHHTSTFQSNFNKFQAQTRKSRQGLSRSASTSGLSGLANAATNKQTLNTHMTKDQFEAARANDQAEATAKEASTTQQTPVSIAQTGQQVATSSILSKPFKSLTSVGDAKAKQIITRGSKLVKNMLKATNVKPKSKVRR